MMIRMNESTIHSQSQITPPINLILLLVRYCFAAFDIAKHKIKTNMSAISLSRTAPFAILGCILSAYALYVEHKVANKPEEEEFSAFCDIELIGASCSNVFQLPEGRMLTYFNIVPEGSILDVPNAALGLLFYSYWLFLMPTLPNVLTVIVSSMAMASSVFLAIKLVMLNELCILCWSTHAINSRIFWSVMANLVLGGNSNNSGNKKKIKTIKRV